MHTQSPWMLTTALPVLLSFTLCLVYALHILAHPPRRRKTAFALFCVPWAHAFAHHLRLSPWYALNDTFGRMLYIWLAHMSYAFLLLRIDPAPGCSGYARRLRWAGKVVFARHMAGYVSAPPDTPSPVQEEVLAPSLNGVSSWSTTHRLPRTTRFCAYHLVKAALFLAVNFASDTLIHTPAPDALQLRARLHMAWDTCVGDMLYLDAVYSLFAVLCVGVLRLDAAAEWDLSLLGCLADAYSVRRYWGVYWHDYIRASFSAHVRVLTRGWCGMGRSTVTRGVENGIVFVVSGGLHSLVRYVQTEGEGEVWTVALWYAAQMLPIVVEGLVQHVWATWAVRLWFEVMVGKEMVGRLERAGGYVWVFGWMVWSVPKYLHTRNAWEMENLKSKYPELFSRAGEDL